MLNNSLGLAYYASAPTYTLRQHYTITHQVTLANYISHAHVHPSPLSLRHSPATIRENNQLASYLSMVASVWFPNVSKICCV